MSTKDHSSKFLPQHQTNPLIWLIAIICAILAVAVIFTGILVIIVYIIYQPKMPYLLVTDAHLNQLDYDQSGLLVSNLNIDIIAENDNRKSHATFSELRLKLEFHGIDIAEMRAGEFEMVENSSVPLNYVVASAVPLDELGMAEIDASLRRDLVRFELNGQARMRWRVGFIVHVKLWTHLSCGIKFFVSNGTTTGLDCNSRSHSL